MGNPASKEPSFLGLQEGKGPAHSSSQPPAPAGLERPARHTPDLNGQPAVEGRQCLDRTQFLIRELRVGLGQGGLGGGADGASDKP